MKTALVALGLFSPFLVQASPEGDLRDAVTALSRTSYRWETTVRQRFKGETTEPRVNLNAAVETRGATDPRGFTEISVIPTRDGSVPATVVFRQGDVVAHTPAGWLRRGEIRQSAGPDREIEFEGRHVRLSRVFAGALQAMALRPPAEELFDLIADLKSSKVADGLILAELRDRTVEQLWGDAQAKRAPEIQGTVIFRITDQGLSDYHVVLAIGFPNSRTKTIAWSMQQWTTRITSVGSATVEPPEAAVRALEQ